MVTVVMLNGQKLQIMVEVGLDFYLTLVLISVRNWFIRFVNKNNGLRPVFQKQRLDGSVGRVSHLQREVHGFISRYYYSSKMLHRLAPKFPQTS